MDSTHPEQIESERLVIRVARPGDGAIFNEAILDSPYPKIGCHSTSH